MVILLPKDDLNRAESANCSSNADRQYLLAIFSFNNMFSVQILIQAGLIYFVF